MRLLLVTFTALALPGLADAAPQCALPSGPASALLPVALPSPPTRAQSGTAAPVVIPADQIGRIPALRRIASKGAQLLDLGTEHGLKGVFARNGNTFQVFYLTPDGEAVIGGVMWDAAGRNVTRRQVTPVEGAIPTVTIGMPAPAPAHLSTAAAVPAATSLTAALKGTTIGTAGDPKAPKLWVYIDPLCSFSVRAMAQLRPYIAAGRVQLAVIPLAVLDYEDQGRSTLAAKAMLSLPPGDMVAAWGANKLTGPADPAAAARLSANMASAEAIGLRGTPTFLWRTADGKEGRSDGLPPNLEAVIAAIGR